jgi:hypothetical protein
LSMMISAVGKVDSVVIEVDSDHAYTRGKYKVVSGADSADVMAFLKCRDDVYHTYIMKDIASPYGIVKAFESEGYEVFTPSSYSETMAAANAENAEDVEIYSPSGDIVTM